ncbi:tRNA uridine-5-carboxymethylaminomethyl(34) synthesis GTPase MnmE [Arenimonas sp.]|uniref:tRNA uridine-5-carboxymethylaminomethyl(34) synthesis GTPase MnmE n=1 Tax=Arenimonas sp. TaxID=1872635 RepID=UPI0039E4CC34
MPQTGDTIAAIATAAGAAGVGIVRLSGPKAATIAARLAGRSLLARQAHYVRLRDSDGELIDDGIAICFPAPHSYTGEDVVELQTHGNPLLLARVLRCCLALGARAARAGEFTERAFLNDKLDLAQAEALADLISAGSEAAARAARRSLDGEFSRRVHAIGEQLVGLRVWVEAALDFPEEEIDFLAAPELTQRLQQARHALASLRAEAERGKRLVDGLHAVLVGAPNAGKSSLLNALAGEDRAIVTEIAGTTRDLLRETINLDGFVLTLVDTAGLRDSDERVEAEGIRRAHAELARADLALAVIDDTRLDQAQALAPALAGVPKVIWLHNKIDLAGAEPRQEQREDGLHLWLSARTGEGIELLHDSLRAQAGSESALTGGFSARLRHLDALARAAGFLSAAEARLTERQGELAAEDLRQANDALGEITGRFDADALLGRIFSSFCIGK